LTEPMMIHVLEHLVSSYSLCSRLHMHEAGNYFEATRTSGRQPTARSSSKISFLNSKVKFIYMKMDSSHPTEPEIADYYADLGVPQQASVRDIKLAFFKLAKKHHPDKNAPGESIDAEDFRKASFQKHH
jgi:DnaJ-domain-containing protein 1